MKFQTVSKNRNIFIDREDLQKQIVRRAVVRLAKELAIIAKAVYGSGKSAR